MGQQFTLHFVVKSKLFSVFSILLLSHFNNLDLIRTSEIQQPEIHSCKVICSSSPGGNIVVGTPSGIAEASKETMETSYVLFLMKKFSNPQFSNTCQQGLKALIPSEPNLQFRCAKVQVQLSRYPSFEGFKPLKTWCCIISISC